ncbi:DUF1120 domain-containing protein [Pseudomonas sp. NPDC098747]|uniref:DUF1120 domain-containing protein n=1 Tax=Pseudomonas sp. NPDC098747 TaxID=3364487 RepID=UPI00383B631B
MKKLLLLPLALAFASNAAMAANSVDISVTGTITPNSCVISLYGGDFDLGTIAASALSDSEFTRLPTLWGKRLDILCAGPHQVGFKAIDNRRDENGGTGSFGLGRDGANNPIGDYVLHMNETTAFTNGKLKESWDSGNSWEEVSRLPPINNRSTVVYAFDTATSSNTATPLPMTSGNVQLLLSATVRPLSELDTSAEITIDGSATFELVYL